MSEDGTYFSEIESPTKRFFSMLGTLIQGRVSVCGAAINASKVALAIAVRHADARRQFGPPDGEEVTLMTYRTHQRRVLPHLADAYALHFAQERLVATLAERFGEEGERGRELETMAAGLKALGTWHATTTIQACREACGGQGYLRANRFAALKADTDVFTTFEGDNTVLLQLVAKNLLTGFKHEYADLNTLGTAAFFAGQLFETIAERSALRELIGRIGDDLLPGRDEETDLLEREAQLDALRWREEHLLAGLARRLRGGLDGDTDPFELLIACQDHLVLAARAYVDRIVLEAFADAVERAPESHRELLGRLCDLHALALFERERGYFRRARPLLVDPLEGRHQGREHRVRRHRAAREAAGRRVRDPRVLPRELADDRRRRLGVASALGVRGRVERGPQRLGGEVRERSGERERGRVRVAVLLAREAGLVAVLDESIEGSRAAPRAAPGSSPPCTRCRGPRAR